MIALLWACFFLSGAAALALEMLWMRSAGLVCGATAAATATVLACYFGGLAVGARLGTRVRAEHAMRSYGLLELSAAIGAVWSLGAFRFASQEPLLAWLTRSGALLRIGFVAFAVGPATVCFGATLPVLATVLVARDRLGPRGAALYALNTLGGAAGAAAAGFGLPLWVGVRWSYAAAAGASALAGLVALAIARSDVQSSTTIAVSPREPTPRRPHTRLTLVAFGIGAVGLGLEVCWTRLFAQVLHNSIYSFTAVTLVFVLAIAAGTGAAALLLARFDAKAVASGALACASLATLGGAWWLVRSTDGLAYVGMRTGLGEYVARILALASTTAGPAAFASGVALPAVWAAWGPDDGVAAPIGSVVAVNAVGGVTGALLAGFVGFPTIGLRGTMLLAALAYVVLADVGAVAVVRPLGYLAVLAAALLDPMRAPIVHLRPGADALLDTIEGPSGIATVVETEGDRQLRLDNYYLLGGSTAATQERRLGLLPLLLHPAPREVAFVGLATGISASAAVALGVPHITVFELASEVAEAARRHFGAWNGDLLGRKEVQLVLGDGRAGLAATDRRLDVIVSDLFIPWHAGATSLYAREMYEGGARRLAPGGLYCQWLPLYQLTRDEFEIIARTFVSVFPRTSVWRADFYPDRPVLALIGQTGSRRVDLAAGAERMATVPDWARDPLLAEPAGLAMLYAGDLASSPDLVPAGPLNSDERPRIEFLAPRLTRMGRDGDKCWFMGTELADFVDDLAQRNPADDPILGPGATLSSARRAGRLLSRFAIAARDGDRADATRLQAEVQSLVPEVVAAAEASSSATTLADARRALTGLENEQDAVRLRLDTLESRLRTLTAGPEGGR